MAESKSVVTEQHPIGLILKLDHIIEINQHAPQRSSNFNRSPAQHIVYHYIYISIYLSIYLVGGLGFKQFLFSIIHGIVLPIYLHIFQDG